MNESVLFVSDINKCSIKGRHNTLDLSEIYISNRITTIVLLFVKLNEPMVFHKSNRYLRRTYINNQIFIHLRH
ncbi:hypothetical protein SDC9_145430 [bioreactor metagenome]|uniref:Uncharacterized protein n=1 Tax=bioreactor metagenome TaxID=1076179 RepID=A0A645E9U9_9ZZZZ